MKKNEPVIRAADFYVYVRSEHYKLLPDGFSIDNRMVGVCKKCLKDKNDFQKNSAVIIYCDDYSESKPHRFRL